MMLPSVDKITKVIEKEYPRLGRNKKQEFVRLFFEIAKREDVSPESIINDIRIPNNKPALIKEYLLQRRFPSVSPEELKVRSIFPRLSLNPDNEVERPRAKRVDPKQVFIEESVWDSKLANRFRERLGSAEIVKISKYSQYIEAQKYETKDFNKRREQFFIVNEKFDLFLPCPCTPSAESCGYFILNLGRGCAYDCSYCFLQSYTNSPGIVFPANLTNFFECLEKINTPVRVGTGQFTDSLVFDDLTGYSTEIMNFLEKKPNITFEFKTKSLNVENLLNHKPLLNVVVSWSLNPQNIVDYDEWGAASLIDRINCAKACSQAGYQVGFHLDPIIYSSNWGKEYSSMLDYLFSSLDAKKIGWISLGCLRMTVKQKTVIENRFPDNKFLDEEFILGFDKKLRYPKKLRLQIYRVLIDKIRSRCRDISVYLCMEDKEMYSSLSIDLCEHVFKNYCKK